MPRFNKGGGGLYHPQGHDVDEVDNLLVHIDRPKDAFDRLRVSEPHTIFDSKQIFDNQPLFWDDQEESGGSTTSTHTVVSARTRLLVLDSAVGVRTRQTFRRFNYQPGKSQQIFMTGILTVEAGATGITRRIGIFDDDNGLFFEDAEGTTNIVIRTKASGSIVDTAVAQSSWDDPMDGTGRSGITLDFTKTQIFAFDFEWLGVGDVRFSIIIDGEIIVVHTVPHANVDTLVYMSTPNLPLRYQIISTTTGGNDIFNLDAMCATVISEGGQQDSGKVLYKSTAPTGVTASTADVIYALIGFQLKTTTLAESMEPLQVSVMNEGTQDMEWTLRLNPTVAGTFTYSDISNSNLQSAAGATANVVTSGSGVIMAGGLIKSGKDSGDITLDLKNSIELGAAIDDTRDTLVLCVMPFANAGVIQGGLTWRERVG